MKVNAVFPVLMTDRLAESRDFYADLLGQRHFITHDPNEVAVDVVQVIPVTSEEAASHYASDLLPG
jgi:hypothetical protein